MITLLNSRMVGLAKHLVKSNGDTRSKKPEVDIVETDVELEGPANGDSGLNSEQRVQTD